MFYQQVMMNSLWFNKDLKAATDIARIHHQLVPNTLYYESWIDSVSNCYNYSYDLTNNVLFCNVLSFAIARQFARPSLTSVWSAKTVT